MCEIWLRSNRRALVLGMLIPAGVGLFGLASAAAWLGPANSLLWRSLGAVLFSIALLLLSSLCVQWRRPRVGYRDGHVLFNLRSGSPIRVPIDVVEAFLMGQGSAMLKGQHRSRETATVVVRLAEAASDWARVDVHPRLASWCDGYITIRGTWCEPLDVRVVNRLNQRLADAKMSEPEKDQVER